jgi:hypothetical protein
VQQAFAFFRDLNRHKEHPTALELPYGSEACLTLAQHLACVERRLGGLIHMAEDTTLDREARLLAARELTPRWERIRGHVLAEAQASGWPIDEPISPDDECLSPSDFGFHNAILAADGRLRFIDFEYAGWDDPAKIVCDFFCQPAVPLPEQFAEFCSREVVHGLTDPEKHLRRIALLLPVYRIKWCCIMLNEFLPVGARRRSIARDWRRQDEWKAEQLHKVRGSLGRL